MLYFTKQKQLSNYYCCYDFLIILNEFVYLKINVYHCTKKDYERDSN